MAMKENKNILHSRHKYFTIYKSTNATS